MDSGVPRSTSFVTLVALTSKWLSTQCTQRLHHALEAPADTSAMKQRITYMVKNPESFTPEQLSLSAQDQGQTFAIRNVDAVKEHRLTAGLDELPKEVHVVIQLQKVDTF